MGSIATSKKVPSNSDLIPAPISMCLHDGRDNDSSLYIQFELQRRKNNECVPGDSVRMEETKETVEPNKEHIDTITNVLMNRKNSYVNPKPNTTHRDNQQFNALVALVKEKNGVSDQHHFVTLRSVCSCFLNLYGKWTLITRKLKLM